jgi:hypothetical protein
MRCPVCRADNSAGPQCRRCRADLSLLFALEERRRGVLAEAVRAASAGDWQQAVSLAEVAHGLRRGEDTRRLQAIGRLLQGDFAGAWRWYSERSPDATT